MKKSKAGSGGIKRFFLYNIEKLILLVSLVLLGLFFYLGLSSEKFDKTPDNLVRETNQATSFIEKTSSWDDIKEYRQGDVEVVDRVKQASKPVDAANFKIAGLSMVPKALQLRLDPPLPKIQDVEATVLRAAVIVQNKQTNAEDPILNLPLARVKEDPDAKKFAMADSLRSRDDDDDDEFRRGGPPRRASRNKREKKEKDPQAEAEVDAWTGMPGVQEAMQGGIRLQQPWLLP